MWKVLVVLLLTLPVTAYVAGTLIASGSEMPAQRAPIEISDRPSDDQDDRGDVVSERRQRRDAPGAATQGPGPARDGKDVTVVKPAPRQLADSDDGGDDSDNDGGDDGGDDDVDDDEGEDDDEDD